MPNRHFSETTRFDVDVNSFSNVSFAPPAVPFLHNSSENPGFSREKEYHGAHSNARHQDRSPWPAHY